MKISKGVVMIITGAGGGFGKALVEEFAPKGAQIYGTYLTNKRSAQIIQEKYSNVKMEMVDNLDHSLIENFVKGIIKKHGKIDVLINNAGSIQQRENIVDLSIDNFQNLLDVHVVGNFVFCKNVLPFMIQENSGVIVNIASRFGLFEWAKTGFGALNVAKAGVNMLTKVLFQELQGTNIRVNSIMPAPTVTNFLSTVFSKDEIDTMRAKGLVGEIDELVAQVETSITDKSLNGEFIISKRLK